MSHEFDMYFANIIAVDLPELQTKTIHSPFLTISAGSASAISATQKNAGRDVVWDNDVLQLCVKEEYWIDPEALITMLVQNDRRPVKPNVLNSVLYSPWDKIVTKDLGDRHGDCEGGKPARNGWKDQAANTSN